MQRVFRIRSGPSRVLRGAALPTKATGMTRFLSVYEDRERAEEAKYIRAREEELRQRTRAALGKSAAGGEKPDAPKGEDVSARAKVALNQILNEAESSGNLKDYKMSKDEVKRMAQANLDKILAMEDSVLVLILWTGRGLPPPFLGFSSEACRR
jgi:hypothetical protein